MILGSWGDAAHADVLAARRCLPLLVPRRAGEAGRLAGALRIVEVTVRRAAAERVLAVGVWVERDARAGVAGVALAVGLARRTCGVHPAALVGGAAELAIPIIRDADALLTVLEHWVAVRETEAGDAVAPNIAVRVGERAFGAPRVPCAQRHADALVGLLAHRPAHHPLRAGILARGRPLGSDARIAGLTEQSLCTYAKRVLNKLNVTSRAEVAQMLTWQAQGGPVA